MTTLPTDLVAVLNRQCGIFTRSQAYAHGLTEKQLRCQVGAERWRFLTREVFAAFTGPVHARHLEWFAVLAAGSDSRLSHETAAHHHGLTSDRPSAPHVLIPFERRIARLHGCVVHRTRSARRTVGTPAMTTVADTLCDLATGGWTKDRLAAATAHAVQRRLVSPAEIHAAIGSRGRFRGVGVLRALAHDTGAGAHSALEVRFLRDVERAHGLPRGDRQSRAVRSDGRITYRDVHYRDFRLTVELDGREHHGSFESRLADLRRDRLAAEGGELTLRYAWKDVASSPCAVARELGAALSERGWTGTPRTCRFCGV